AVRRLDPLHTRPMPDGSTVTCHCSMQGSKQPQRIGMAVAPPEARPGDVWAERDLRQEPFQRLSVQHLPVRLALAALVVKPEKVKTALLELDRAKTESQAAVLLVGEVDPRLGRQP